MTWKMTDGGRAEAGIAKGRGRDCVVRAIAIATGKAYEEVFDGLIEYAKMEKLKRKRVLDPRGGVHRSTYDRYLKAIGWEFVPTMGIGTGCKVHLRAEELPAGRIIARCSAHVVAVIDGVIHDTHDPSRNGTRCVYGYYRKIAMSPAEHEDASKRFREAMKPSPAAISGLSLILAKDLIDGSEGQMTVSYLAGAIDQIMRDESAELLGIAKAYEAELAAHCKPDEKGYCAAPDSVVWMALRRIRSVIAKHEARA